MAKIEEFVLASGVPFKYEGYTLVPPKLKIIRDEEQCGYFKYLNYLYPFCTTKEDLLTQASLMDWYLNLSSEEQSAITVYNLLTYFDRDKLQQAIQFFVQERVVYQKKTNSFLLCKGKSSRTSVATINNDNFFVLCDGIRQLNYRSGVSDDNPDDFTFRSEKAKEKYKKMLKLRQQFLSAKQKTNGNDNSYELGNVVTSLSAKSSTYNLLNIFDLTVYQLYDQFTKTIRNNQIDTYAHKWAAWGTEDFDFSLWFKNEI